MKKRTAIKNHRREIQLIMHRSRVTVILMAVAITLLIFRLIELQLIENARYTTLSRNNWLELVPIEPPRGLIYDRNGILLADNIPVFSLDIIPNQVNDLPATLTQLRQWVNLSENDLSQFQKQLKQRRRFDEIPLKLKLTEQEMARIAENQFRLPGVVIKARMMRYYPYGHLFSHVVGYVGRINSNELQEIDTVNYSANYYIGKSGIEKYYEDELHGKVGYEQVEKEANGKPVRTLKEIQAIPGKNITLTIDAHLQEIAEKALDQTNGAIIALDPKTGQVLAFVSHPTFDPNLFVQGVKQKEYDALRSSRDRPLFNRVLHGLYPLASTIKPYLALEALRTHLIDNEFKVYDPGWYTLPDSTHIFHDWQRKGHGWVNLHEAISKSCDTYFYQLAHKMGMQHIDTILNQFGFGEVTGIDLEGELAGNVASPEWKLKVKGESWYPGDTVMSGIGQGYMLATPLQMASSISIIANHGKRYIPYLQLGEATPGENIKHESPILIDHAVVADQATWESVIHAMENVATDQGTGFRFGKHDYRIAMKTGTAQVIATKRDDDEISDQTLIPKQFRDHHLLIAFAPTDDPKMALAIVTENSNQTMAIARTLFNYYLGKYHAETTQSA